MVKCFFCQKEYNDTRGILSGTVKLPMLYKCKEHNPNVSFTDENSFVFSYKELNVSVNLIQDTLEIERIYVRNDEAIINNDEIIFELIIKANVPETRDISQFIEFIDRLLELRAFS